MKAFDVVTAKDSAHAVALLAEHGADARVLAGGTDLLVDLKTAPQVPRVLVDISRAEDLKQIAITEQGLAIGALVSHTAIMRSPLIGEMFPALVDAARTIGAVQTRNLGTLGGNLVTAVPSMDSGPTLVALEATVTLAGPQGARHMPLTEFFLGPRRTALRHDELLTEIVIPKRNLGKPAHFLKFGLRKGQALAIVNVAASLWLDAERNTLRAPRIALGAVAPVVLRAAGAEAFLEGREVTAKALAEAGRLAVADAKPISDFRASAEYRRDLIAVLTRRALEGACALARTRLEGQEGRKGVAA
jgi:CO/xanthine dehydrogenase FAD-binding subunit